MTTKDNKRDNIAKQKFETLTRQRNLRNKLGNICLQHGIYEEDLFPLIEKKRREKKAKEAE